MRLPDLQSRPKNPSLRREARDKDKLHKHTHRHAAGSPAADFEIHVSSRSGVLPRAGVSRVLAGVRDGTGRETLSFQACVKRVGFLRFVLLRGRDRRRGLNKNRQEKSPRGRAVASGAMGILFRWSEKTAVHGAPAPGLLAVLMITCC